MVGERNLKGVSTGNQHNFTNTLWLLCINVFCYSTRADHLIPGLIFFLVEE